MNKQTIIILILPILGALAGIAFMSIEDNDVRTTRADRFPTGTTLPASSSPWDSVTEPDAVHRNELENKIIELELRVSELEQAAHSQAEASTDTKTPPSRISSRSIRLDRLLSIKSLVKAGLSEEMATDMVRHRNDIELKKLELRDHAAREGYLGSKRYMKELTFLLNEETSLREDLGDEAYDRYLFSNGQHNRVKVASVMLGSAAEEAGMKDGDLILTYGESRMFEGFELKKATSEGELGEYVNVDILRDGQLMSLWMPRGPLGVRLGAARVAP